MQHFSGKWNCSFAESALISCYLLSNSCAHGLTNAPESSSKHTMQVDLVISNLFNTAAGVGVVNLHIQGSVFQSRTKEWHDSTLFTRIACFIQRCLCQCEQIYWNRILPFKACCCTIPFKVCYASLCLQYFLKLLLRVRANIKSGWCCDVVHWGKVA